MSRSKPVLKRSFQRSAPRHRHSRGAFIVAVLLTGFMIWIFIRVLHPTSKPSLPQTRVNKIASPVPAPTPSLPPKKTSGFQSQGPKAEAKIVPVQKPYRATAIQPSSKPTESIVIEKDSMTFPGRAPRLEHKKPALITPSNSQHLDWRKPSIVFVIDDIGHELTYDAVIERLGNKITYAILPHLRYTRFYGEKSRKTGADVILHLPLESERGIYPGPGLITRFMPENEIRRMVSENLNNIPNQIGANNHMGSLGTSDDGLMRIILDEFRQRRLFFLDSFTSPRSHVVAISREMHIPVLRRDVFLDNVEQPEPIRQQIAKTAQIARNSGYAIAIGHYKKHTLEVIAEEIPKLEKQGFQIVKLSDLMKRYN